MRLSIRLCAAILLAAVAAVSLSGGAGAEPGTGECVQAAHDDAIALLDSPNDEEGGSLGDAIADGLYGNEPNLLNTNTDDDLGPNEVEPGSSAGSVVPSLSPGP